MLSEFDNLHSTIKVGKNQNSQLLFASQSYGTNYFIYGYFKTSKTAKESCTISGLKMLMLNYKGILDLGFSLDQGGEPRVSVSKIEDDDKDPMLKVDFSLQAVVSENTVQEIDIDFKNEINIKERTNLKVLRKLLPISGDIEMPPITKGVFDNEFYYRDGLSYARRVVRDIADDGNCFPVYGIDQSIVQQTGPGIKCRVANFQIDFNV